MSLESPTLRMLAVNHLFKQLNESMLGYQVNGNPVQREFTLHNMANKLYADLTVAERAKLLSDILTS